MYNCCNVDVFANNSYKLFNLTTTTTKTTTKTKLATTEKKLQVKIQLKKYIDN